MPDIEVNHHQLYLRTAHKAYIFFEIRQQPLKLRLKIGYYHRISFHIKWMSQCGLLLFRTILQTTAKTSCDRFLIVFHQRYPCFCHKSCPKKIKILIVCDCTSLNDMFYSDQASDTIARRGQLSWTALTYTWDKSTIRCCLSLLSLLLL